MNQSTQLVMQLNINKSFNVPARSTPLHTFRVGAEGSSMIDLTIPLGAGQKYALRHNFTSLVLRSSNRISFTGVCGDLVEENGSQEFRQVKMIVNGLAVLTDTFQAITIENLTKEQQTIIITGACTEGLFTATLPSYSSGNSTPTMPVTTMTRKDLESMIEAVVSKALTKP